jgi:hypothetical protein
MKLSPNVRGNREHINKATSPFSPGNCDVVMMHYNAYNPSKYMMQRYIVTC